MASTLDRWQLNQNTQRDSFRYLLNNEEISDVIFVIGDERIPAHTFLLTCRSPVFHDMFKEKPKEGVEKREIEVSDIDADTFIEVLRYVS